MPQMLQNWWRMVAVEGVLGQHSSPRSSVKVSRGVKASTEPRRRQREQLQVIGDEMSTSTSKATAPHWQDPWWLLDGHSSAP